MERLICWKCSRASAAAMALARRQAIRACRQRDSLGQFQESSRLSRAALAASVPGHHPLPRPHQLMGRHIDHQGRFRQRHGRQPRNRHDRCPAPDDLVCLANTDGRQFSEQTSVFRPRSQLNWDDWQRVIDGPRLQRLLESARAIGHYIKAAVLRLQELFRDRRLRGADIMVSGRFPWAPPELSSALVVARRSGADIHRLRSGPPARQPLRRGEWFVGTAAERRHAAIKLRAAAV